MSRVRLARIFWIGAAVVLAAAALVAVAAVIRGELTETDGRILATLGGALLAGGCLIAGLALAGSGRAKLVGRTTDVVAPVALAVIVWVIWSFDGDGEGENLWRWLWSAVLLLVAALLTTTSLLLARRHTLVVVASVASVLVGLATAATIAAIWSGDDPDDTALKAIATLWILGVLAWFLVPVLGRLLAAPPDRGVERILATEGDVELVATRAAGERGIDAVLQPDERLVLRRRAPR